MYFSTRRARELTICATALVFVGILAAGIQYGARFVSADLMIVRGVHEGAIPGITQLVLEASDLGGTTVALTLMILAAAGLLATRHWHASFALVVSVLGTQAIVHLIKGTVERSRPPSTASQVEAAGYSFPSAHSATSVALYGMLALIAVAHMQGRARRWACLMLAGVIALVGATRIYLGAHYPTDVLAGWLLGAVVALATWRLAQFARRRYDRWVAAPAMA